MAHAISARQAPPRRRQRRPRSARALPSAHGERCGLRGIAPCDADPADRSHAGALPAWADQLGDRPVVYVSLGTAPLFNQPAKFEPLLAGLTEAEVEVVVTVSRLHDLEALGKRPETVHVEQWLPLPALLPRCDAVICHAGTGTTLAALAAGLSLVLVPQGADQFDDARARAPPAC